MSPTHLHRHRPSVVAFIAVFLLTLAPALPVAANSTAQTPPFSQDWHDTSLITTNDDWSGVAGIMGFLGQDITTVSGADPQTLLTDSAAPNDQDVIANLPFTSFTNAGVAEFEIADPVIALQGNGTADAPYIRIALQTTGLRNVVVAYDLRDVDATSDNAVQPVALQFRIGSSGAWTNVPAGFVADATTGPSLATQVTPVSVVLPDAASDQSLLQVRIITANAVPTDEWVGVDNLVVTASVPDNAPVVESTTPHNGAGDVARDANLSVTFSEPVEVSGGWFAIECTTSGTHAGTFTGGPLTYSIDPADSFAYDESCRFTVYAQDVTDQDADDPPDLMVADHEVTFGTVAAPPPPPPDDPPTVPDDPPTVDAGGPYSVVEHGRVIVNASGSDQDGQALTYRWDLDGDGTFETPGQSAKFSAARLEAPRKVTILVQATDPTGLTATDEATVNVIWKFKGFNHLRKVPIANAVNRATKTLRFSLGGNQGLDIFRAGYPASAAYACGTTPPTAAVRPALVRAKGVVYRTRTNEYSFRLKVDKSWKNTCRVFVLGLADGTMHNVAFRFR